VNNGRTRSGRLKAKEYKKRMRIQVERARPPFRNSLQKKRSNCSRGSTRTDRTPGKEYNRGPASWESFQRPAEQCSSTSSPGGTRTHLKSFKKKRLTRKRDGLVANPIRKEGLMNLPAHTRSCIEARSLREDLFRVKQVTQWGAPGRMRRIFALGSKSRNL